MLYIKGVCRRADLESEVGCGQIRGLRTEVPQWGPGAKAPAGGLGTESPEAGVFKKNTQPEF